MQSQPKKIFVYNLEDESVGDESHNENVQIKEWTPGFTTFIPPNSSLSYLFFWCAHYLRLFKNRDYCGFVIYESGVPVCSLVCVPALKRWSFMNSEDVQIKNVFTHRENRGQGLAFLLVKQSLQRMKKEGRVFWYMTHDKNIPSQKLCKKVGFKYVGEYNRTRNNFFFYQGKVTQNSM